MSLFGFINKSVNSELFTGSNIIKYLKNSTFGLFQKTIKDLDLSNDKLKIPKIIVIGSESSGKSSLLENLIKCDVFPRDRNICTKCPIKLKLFCSDVEEYKIIYNNNYYVFNNKNEIIHKITDIMKLIDNIIDDEIIIEIYQPNIYNFEFIDLPGIREYPQELRETSKNLVNKYLMDDNTIILCVIPCNCPRLTTSQALGMIIDANKIENTIIALTMTDLVHEDDKEVLIINRILKKSDEFINLNVPACIAVINRTHLNKISLEEAEKKENEWFNKNILDFINKDNKQIIIDINNNIKIVNILNNLDKLFHNFICNKWKYTTLSDITPLIDNFKQEYNNLGDINLNYHDIINHINNNNIIDYDYILTLIINKCNIYKYNRDNDHDIIDINETLLLNNQYLILKSFDISEIKTILINEFEIQFKKCINFESDYNLKRYDIIFNYIISIIKEIINKELELINEWFTTEIIKLKYDLYIYSKHLPRVYVEFNSINILINKLIFNISNYIICNIKNNILNLYDQNIYINYQKNNIIILSEILLKDSKNTSIKENKEWSDKRIKLEMKIKKYENSFNIISNIESKLNNIE